MKLFKTTALIFLLAAPILAAAEDSAQPNDLSREVVMEMGAELQQTFDTEAPVRIEYLLDTEGRPYIISIWSTDEHVTRMVRKMIGNEIDTEHGGSQSLAITFYYNNIR